MRRAYRLDDGWIPGVPGEQPFDVERARRVMAEANELWESAQPLRT